ncbi:MAG: DUF1800 domain-containing protein [Betaproteobacteria bacterium]|jgi:uncharacterized protein (DUF1800 family)
MKPSRPDYATPPARARRRDVLALVALVVAGCAVVDAPPGPADLEAGGTALRLTADDARHLLVRTGFGASPAEVRALTGERRDLAVDRLLADVRKVAGAPLPPELARFTRPAEGRGADEAERRAFAARQAALALDLRAWWLGEMLRTPAPLGERMTLFWHNHFVSSLEKVKSPALLARQNVLLRRHATGSFADLLRAVARDPAMVLYLDSAQNRKAAPNENFARELMELFTLGEGHYGERDVREAARAFTGWSLDRDTGEFVVRRGQHDRGKKSVLGRSGDLDGDDVIGILLDRPETGRHVVRRLWREFVSPEPDEAVVEAVGRRFQASGHDIRVALRALLLSEAFWAPARRGALIRSPVDLLVGTLRTFAIEVPDPAPLAVLSAGLGQNLLAPPNVKGWPGGEAWIDATTLLARKQFLDRLFRGDGMGTPGELLAGAQARVGGAAPRGPDGRVRLAQALAGIRFDSRAWLASLDDASGPAVARLVLALPPVVADPSGPVDLELLHRLSQDPVYQLR